MKTPIAIATLMLGVALTTAGYADPPDSTVDRSHPKDFVKDSAITAKIKSKLAAQHLSSLDRIHVDTDANGEVYLSGTARSQADIDKAVSIARSTEHVAGVQSDLTVRADK